MDYQYSSAGPHIHNRDSVARTMWMIVIALLPPALVAVRLFGPYALYLMLAPALAAAAIEFLLDRRRFSRRHPLGDGSAFVAGLILGLSLAPGCAWWIPLVGAVLLVVVGKQVFGGLGCNIFNPALVARGILLLSWPRELTAWVWPLDGATGATPLVGLDPGPLALFVGNIPGSLGETSVVALLAGAGFLMVKGLISWRIPVAVLAGAALTAMLVGLDPLFTLLSGSLMFGAVYMATDMVTSPTGKTPQLVYGAGCGALTVLIRRYTVYPEGLTFAFLLMNGLAYLLDRLGADPIFGHVTERVQRVRRAALVAGAVVLMAAVTAAGLLVNSLVSGRRADMSLSAAVRRAYPQAERIVPVMLPDAGVSEYRVYEGRLLLGRFARTRVEGYGGPMVIDAVLDADRGLQSVQVIEHVESPTLGSGIRSARFLSQFSGFRPHDRDQLHTAIEGITGATVSSRSVIRGVERILGAPEHTAAGAGPKLPLPRREDGIYTGEGQGYQGPIAVEVVVRDGLVSAIRVVSHGETRGLADRAIDTLVTRLIEHQSLGVDAVGGATGTSRGLLSAVKDAMGE